MHICTQRERLIQALTKVGGVVEKRQTLPILGNIHIHADDDVLTFTATDREIEIRWWCICIARWAGIEG